MRILLIAGGWSCERDVSLNGARAIEKALVSLGHSVTFFDLSLAFDDLMDVAKEHDFAFINLHGSPGEDGLVQSLLDAANIPYQGSGARGSFLALHKAATKQVYRNVNIPTPAWEYLPVMPTCSQNPKDMSKEWEPKLPYPIFAKSNTGGSSLLLYRANNKEELLKALKEIFAAGEEALLETSIEGQDATCGVLGDEALPPILIRPLAGDFFDYTSKYQSGGAEEICPAPLPENINARMQELALQAHKALGLSGYSRTDFRITKEGEVLTLETNTLPGMTATSLIPQEAAAIGLDFGALLEKLIQLGMQHFLQKTKAYSHKAN